MRDPRGVESAILLSEGTLKFPEGFIKFRNLTAHKGTTGVMGHCLGFSELRPGSRQAGEGLPAGLLGPSPPHTEEAGGAAGEGDMAAGDNFSYL